MKRSDQYNYSNEELERIEKKDKALIGELRDVVNVMSSLDIPFWLTSGTLKGYIKERRIFPNDGDIDIATFKHLINKEVMRKISLKAKKYHFIVHFFWNAATFTRNNITTDLYLYDESKDEKDIIVERTLAKNKVSHLTVRLKRIFSSLFFQGPTLDLSNGLRTMIKTNFLFAIGKIPVSVRKFLYALILNLLIPFEKKQDFTLRIPKETFSELKRINFYGLEVNIPTTSEEYLKIEYGSEWNKPFDVSKLWYWFEHGDWKKIKYIKGVT